MNNSKKTFTTFLIVFSAMLLSFHVADAVLGLMGHFIALDRIALFIAVSISFVFALVKACSGMKVSEIMLTMLLLVLLADGVGIIGFAILSADYMTALFLIPLIIVSFALIFRALRGRKPGKRGKKGKSIALLAFSLVLLALIGFTIVYFHAERLITLKSIQRMQAIEKVDFKAILSAFEVGFDLNRTILVIALAVSALLALVSTVRHRGRGYGTLAFLLGIFIFDGIGICWFAFRTGDYLTGAFLIPLMMVAFSLVIGYMVHRVSGWTPDSDLLGKAMLAFALVFLAVFMVSVGFYYVKSNNMPDEVFLNRELPTPEVIEFGASESFGKGSLAIPTVTALVAAVFLFLATKLSEAPYRRNGNEIPWQILLTIEGIILSFSFIAIGFPFYGILGPILIGVAICFAISAVRRKRKGNTSRAFIAFYSVFLLVYVGGLFLFRDDEVFPVSLPLFLSSLALGAFCSLLLCWALRFMAYRRGNRESIKVIAILIALIYLLVLCFFGYQLWINPPQEIEEEVILVEEPSIEEISSEDSPSASDFPETSIIDEVEVPEEPVVEATAPEVETQPFDIDAAEPEPECEIIAVPEPPVPVLPPKAEITEVEIVVPSAPTGLAAWGWLYDEDILDDSWDEGWVDDWEDDWSEDDWIEDDWSEDDWIDDSSDDDFWADFYIAGEDILEMEDGLYYVNVFINGDRYGEWEIDLVDGDPGLPTDYLAYYLDGELIEEVWESIFFEEDAPYVYLSHLEEIGIETEFNREKYEIHLDFGTDIMPVRSISIAGSSSYYKPRIIEGAMPLEPAKFVLNTRYNLNVNIPSLVNGSSDDYFNADLSLSNTFRIMDWHGSFGMYFRFGMDRFSFDFGSWTGNKDFDSHQLRLSFGNIGGSGGLGIKLEHDAFFGGKKGKSVLSEYITIDVESDVKVFNEDREIYRSRLAPGNYRLEDFTIFTGANRIRIEITPVDGSPMQVIEKDILYSTGMLMPGDYNYGAYVGFGRNAVDSRYAEDIPAGVLSIPWLNHSRILYDFRQVSLRGYFNTGITPSLSISTGLSLGNTPLKDRAWNPSGDMSVELTHANAWGTTRYNFSMRESMDAETRKLKIPVFTARVGHQTSFGNPYVSSLSLNASYSSPANASAGDERHVISLSLGTGGRLGFVSWNLSTYVNMLTDVIEQSSYSVSLTAALLTHGSFSLSASINMGGSFQSTPMVSGRISGSVRFNGGSMNASTDMEGFSATASAGTGNHSFRLGASTSDFADVSKYGLDGSYSYSGNLFGMNASFAMKNSFSDASLSFGLTTSSTFADGLMAFGASIPRNFLMISQKGAIKGNEVSIASIGSSSSMVLPSAFGVSLYAGASPRGDGGFTVYSTPEDTFGSSVAYDISLVPRSGMSGYVLKLSEEPSLNVTGIAVDPEGKPWSNGSSPLYEVVIGDDGLLSPVITDEYVFTDETGRFIFNELKSGFYGFDIDYEGGWYHLVFKLDADDEDVGRMIILEPSLDDNGYRIGDPYSGVIVFERTDAMDGDEFWAMLFPEF